MGRPVGQKKTATQGRKKGAPNKRTLDLVKNLEDLGLDPLAELAEVLFDAKDSYKTLQNHSENKPQFMKIAKDAASDLLKYLYPQRKAVDITSDGEKLQTITDIFASVVNARAKRDSSK